MKKSAVVFAIILCFPVVLFPQVNSINSLKNQIVIENVDTELQPSLDFSESGKKSTILAVAYSLLLPGMGELYAGDYGIGKYLTAADGVFWGALIGFNAYGKWQEDNYKSFAASTGGVDNNNKDEDFYARVGVYMGVEQYNREQDLNRDYSKRYNTQTHYWGWETNEQRKEYRNLWTSSEQAYNNVRFAVGALILNRVVSIINAVRLVNKHNRNLNTELGWNVNFDINQNPALPSTMNLNFSTRF
ncbi:MAG: hypothetical protein V1773_06405 [bacterium]